MSKGGNKKRYLITLLMLLVASPVLAATSMTVTTDTSGGLDASSITTGHLAFTGRILGAVKVVTKNVDYVIGNDDSYEAYGGLFVNTGASTRTFTLPANAAPGMSVCIKNAHATAQIIRLDANTGDYIVKSNGQRTSAPAEYYGSTADAGAFLCVVAVDDTNWHVTAERGTWAEE